MLFLLAHSSRYQPCSWSKDFLWSCPAIAGRHSKLLALTRIDLPLWRSATSVGSRYRITLSVVTPTLAKCKLVSSRKDEKCHFPSPVKPFLFWSLSHSCPKWNWSIPSDTYLTRRLLTRPYTLIRKCSLWLDTLSFTWESGVYRHMGCTLSHMYIKTSLKMVPFSGTVQGSTKPKLATWQSWPKIILLMLFFLLYYRY